MPEWIKAIIDFFRGKASDREEKLWQEADWLRKAYQDLMSDRNKIAMEIRQDLEQQLQVLRDEVGELKAALERERMDHRECRRRLSKNEDEISNLKAQVQVLMQRSQDGGS